jgi:MFS family permease
MIFAVMSLAVGIREAAPVAKPAGGSAAPFVVTPKFKRYLVILLLFTLGNSSDAFLALRSQNLGLSLLALLLAIAAFNATNAIVAWPAGALSDRIGRRGLVALAWIIYAACYAGFALATSAIWVAPLWIAYGTYYALSEGVGKAIVADLAPGELRATAFGILNAVQGTMILPASVIAGVLWSAVAPPAPFWFGAACAAAAAALLLATVRLPAREK